MRQGRVYFEKARSDVLYDGTLYDGTLRDTIHEFNFEGRFSDEAPLTAMIMEKSPYDKDEFDSVVPVPLHVSKLRSREYI